MKNTKIFIAILIPFSLFSCSDPEYYLCKCKYENSKTGVIEISTDTIKNMSKPDAEIECSDHQTTDDENENINCEIQ